MDRPFDPLYVFQSLAFLLPALGVTAYVTVASAVGGTIVGLALARMKLSGSRFLRLSADGYTWALRCTPSIVLLFIVFYGVPELAMALFRVNINFWHRSFFVILTFVLFFSASMSEIFRSAWLSVDRGQWEAAVSAGLTPFEAERRIVLPQAAVTALPNAGNALIALMKEGALAYTVGLIDVMGRGILLVSKNYGARALETYIALAATYWVLTMALERLFLVGERRLSRGKRGLS